MGGGRHPSAPSSPRVPPSRHGRRLGHPQLQVVYQDVDVRAQLDGGDLDRERGAGPVVTWITSSGSQRWPSSVAPLVGRVARALRLLDQSTRTKVADRLARIQTVTVYALPAWQRRTSRIVMLGLAEVPDARLAAHDPLRPPHLRQAPRRRRATDPGQARSSDHEGDCRPPVAGHRRSRTAAVARGGARRARRSPGIGWAGGGRTWQFADQDRDREDDRDPGEQQLDQLPPAGTRAGRPR